MRTRNCLLCGGNVLFSHEKSGEVRGDYWLVFEHGFEAGDVKRREALALCRGETHEVFFGCDEGFGVVADAELEKRVEVRVRICVVVAEGRCCGEVDILRAQCSEKFFGTGDAAEGNCARSWFDHETAVLDPDRRGDIAAAKFAFEMAVFGAEDEDLRAAQRAQGLAEASGGEEMLVQITAVKHDDVDVAGKSAVLKSVVEEVDAWCGLRALGEESGSVAIGSHMDRNSVTGNEEGFVSVV